MSLLLPDGIDHLGDCPFTLHEAILTGLRILGYEEFPKDERPPRNIWFDSDKLNAWWEEVERKREERFKVGADKQPASEIGWEENAVELITRG